MGNYILLTIHASMFGTIQESPVASTCEPLITGNNSLPSSQGSVGTWDSDAPLLPGIVTPDLLINVYHTLVNVGSLYPYNGNCSIQ